MKTISTDVRRYFFIVARLSLVLGILAALGNAYQVLDHWWKEEQSIQRQTMSMNCALRYSDRDLERVQFSANTKDLFDISRLGCGYGIDGKTFLVRREELSLHREGRLLQPNAYPKIDLRQNFLAFFACAALVNLLGLIVFGAYRVVRWVWGRPTVK
jgi:hypothetical protein